MRNEMNVVIGCSKEYAKYATVMLQSLFESNIDNYIKLYVMAEASLEIWEENMEIIAKKYNNEIKFIYLPSNNRTEEVKKFWPAIITIDRWRALSLLPENVERFFMLDIDILIKDDLWELYSSDFDDKYVIVCKDLAFKLNYDSDDKWIVALRNYHIENLIDRYGNFGVSLIDRSFINVFNYDDMLDTIIKNQYLCVDQDYFNLNMTRYIKFIEQYEYNYLTAIGDYQKVIEKIKIVHYAGEKPWKSFSDNPWIKLWFEYAKKIPYCENIVIEYEKTLKDIYLKAWKNSAKYCELMHLWMDIKSSGKTIFDNYNYSSIALYGAGRMCKHLISDLEKTTILCKGIYDKNNLIHDIQGRYIYHNLEEYLKKIIGVDVIIVTPISLFDEIEKMLKEKTNIKIISLKEMISINNAL